MLNNVITSIQYLVVIYFSIQVLYLLFFSLAGKFVKPTPFKTAETLRRIRVFIPGYKEDAVIISTAQDAIKQNYPAHLFDVVIIADSFSTDTLNTLRNLPITVVEVKFEKSTKGKALQKAIAATAHDPVDIVVVLDADNHMCDGFLHAVNNAFETGYEVVQGHRTAKNHETPFALLDACSEEINNHIFRRGHVAVGMPCNLIGSGMAFDWDLFVSLLQNIGDTTGEDKELEIQIVRQRKNIAFLDGQYVFDEKVAHKDVFSQQRSRWIATQIEYLEKYFVEGWMQLLKGNIGFFNKVFQTFSLPRVLLLASLFFWNCYVFLFLHKFMFISSTLFVMLCVALLLGIPKRWFNKNLLYAFMQIPTAFISMLKALLKINKARKKFIHTPHGIPLTK